MAEKESRKMALMAIHPDFADGILFGNKTVEFRRKKPHANIETVLIYATAPIKKIVGFFEVEGIEGSHPEELWSRYWFCAGINKVDYDIYFGSSTKGFAIRVGEVHTFKKALNLKDIDPELSVPQSFYYVNESVLSSIKEKLNELV